MRRRRPSDANLLARGPSEEARRWLGEALTARPLTRLRGHANLLGWRHPELGDARDSAGRSGRHAGFRVAAEHAGSAIVLPSRCSGLLLASTMKSDEDCGATGCHGQPWSIIRAALNLPMPREQTERVSE